MRSDLWDLRVFQLTWQTGIQIANKRRSKPPPASSGWAQCNHKGSYKQKELAEEESRRRNGTAGQSDGMGDELDPPLLVLKMEEGGHKARTSEQLPEAGKDKEPILPWSPWEGTQPR